MACLCCPAGLLLPIRNRSTQARRRLIKQSLQGKRRLPSPVAVLESRNAAAPRKDELLDSDTTTEMMVEIAKDYQNRAFENIKASLNAALDHAKDLVETRVGGEAVSKDIGGSSLESNFSTVLKEAATEVRADAVELIVQKEPADSAGQPQPRYMRRLTDEAVRL